jgi:hypothetical protein
MVTGSSYSVSNIGEDNLAIHQEISMFQKGSVQKAVNYLFDKSSSIGSSTIQSSGIIQSSIISGFSFLKHQVNRMQQVNKENNNQNFFIILYL